MIDPYKLELIEEFNQKIKDKIISDRLSASKLLETSVGGSFEAIFDRRSILPGCVPLIRQEGSQFEDELNRLPLIDFSNKPEKPEKN